MVQLFLPSYLVRVNSDRSGQIEYFGGNDIGTGTAEHLMALFNIKQMLK